MLTSSKGLPSSKRFDDGVEQPPKQSSKRFDDEGLARP